MAFSIVKENLLHLRRPHNQRPTESFDVMDFRSAFTDAFGFVTGREVQYPLERGDTMRWDPVFGRRWDVVVGGHYIVVKISFRRERIGRRFCVAEKLRCCLDLIHMHSNSDRYRDEALAVMMDRFRLLQPRQVRAEQLVLPGAVQPAADEELHELQEEPEYDANMVEWDLTIWLLCYFPL